jgi:versiconal hemiacetal acetate esterase
MPALYGPIDNLHATLAKMFETVASRFEIPPTDTSVKSEDVQVNENYKVRVYHPPGATGHDPLGIYIHGGGWVLCDLDTEDAICRLISKTMNMVLVSVDYRLAPKHKFPAALDDCIDAFEWAISNASKLGVRDTKVTVMGGSAGGNLAIGSVLKLFDEGKGAPISGVIALVPATIHPDVVPADLKSKHTAYEENANLTLNTKSAMMEFWGK